MCTCAKRVGHAMKNELFPIHRCATHHNMMLDPAVLCAWLMSHHPDSRRLMTLIHSINFSSPPYNELLVEGFLVQEPCPEENLAELGQHPCRAQEQGQPGSLQGNIRRTCRGRSGSALPGGHELHGTTDHASQRRRFVECS